MRSPAPNIGSIYGGGGFLLSLPIAIPHQGSQVTCFVNYSSVIKFLFYVTLESCEQARPQTLGGGVLGGLIYRLCQSIPNNIPEADPEPPPPSTNPAWIRHGIVLDNDTEGERMNSPMMAHEK